jgi:SAM-dependent methyltransferase
MTELDHYFPGYRSAEQERLQRQARQLAHEATWLLDQIGLPTGARVVEIGCGPHGCLDLLSERVGRSGRVVGVERSEEAVALARKLVAERGLGNVEILHRDARSTGLPRESFDLTTARLVLVNVPHPEQIIAEAVALARPGGSVAFHEIDLAALVCDPPLHAWAALIDLFVKYAGRNGIDLFIGRRLPRLLREAGLVEVRVNPIVHVYPAGHGRRHILLDFAENLSERVLAHDLIAEQALTDLKEALRRHLDDPETLVVVGPYFQVWGRKPV